MLQTPQTPAFSIDDSTQYIRYNIQNGTLDCVAVSGTGTRTSNNDHKNCALFLLRDHVTCSSSIDNCNSLMSVTNRERKRRRKERSGNIIIPGERTPPRACHSAGPPLVDPWRMGRKRYTARHHQQHQQAARGGHLSVSCTQNNLSFFPCLSTWYRTIGGSCAAYIT